MDPSERHAAHNEIISLILRGIAAILFGVAALFWPGITLMILLYLFSAFIIVSGLITFIGGLVHLYGGNRSPFARAVTIVIGIIEIGIGVYLIRNTTVSFTVLILLIAFALIVRGVLEIVAGLFEKRSARHRIFESLVGVLAIVAGIILLFQPATAGIAFVWLIGLYALISGPILIAIAFAVRNELQPFPVIPRPAPKAESTPRPPASKNKK